MNEITDDAVVNCGCCLCTFNQGLINGYTNSQQQKEKEKQKKVFALFMAEILYELIV